MPILPTSRSRRLLALTAAAAAVSLASSLTMSTASATASSPPAGPAFHQLKLISDIDGNARLTDSHVVNPWGIALGQTPLWVANNGSNTATVYAWSGSGPVSPAVLTVNTSPGPTGQVFNSTTGFNFRVGNVRVPSRFLFDTLGGAVSAWSNEPSPAPSVTDVATVRNHVYTGLAVANTGAGPRLFAADATGGVDVFDSRFRLVARPHVFEDPHLPDGLTPYNVAVFGTRVYVTYAAEDESQPPAVSGVLDVYSLRGVFLKRLVTGDPLEGAWGMVMAPADWGSFGGALLVGNEDGGEIHAFDPKSGAFLGTISNKKGKPIAHDGLWGLAFGNGIFGRPTDLIFAAGIDEYAHGLVGVIRPNAS